MYWQLLRDPRLIGYALSSGFFYAGAYAFIVGTPFAYIDYYHVSPQAYGWQFGVNILGMMVANFVIARLLNLMGSERLFYRGAWVLAISGVAIVVCAWFGWGGLWGLVVPIFFYMSMNGFIVANSVAGALAFFPQRAGSASSLLGAMHYGSGIFSAALVSWLSDGSPKRMALVMGGAGARRVHFQVHAPSSVSAGLTESEAAPGAGQHGPRRTESKDSLF